MLLQGGLSVVGEYVDEEKVTRSVQTGVEFDNWKARNLRCLFCVAQNLYFTNSRCIFRRPSIHRPAPPSPWCPPHSSFGPPSLQITSTGNTCRTRHWRRGVQAHGWSSPESLILFDTARSTNPAKWSRARRSKKELVSIIPAKPQHDTSSDDSGDSCPLSTSYDSEDELKYLASPPPQSLSVIPLVTISMRKALRMKVESSLSTEEATKLASFRYRSTRQRVTAWCTRKGAGKFPTSDGRRSPKDPASR